jgi:hypothetical protein
MAGVNLDRVQIFLEPGAPEPQGCSVYFVVDNVDELWRWRWDCFVFGDLSPSAPAKPRRVDVSPYPPRRLLSFALPCSTRPPRFRDEPFFWVAQIRI